MMMMMMMMMMIIESRDSSVGIATGYGLDNRMIGVQFPTVARNFSLRHYVQTAPINWFFPWG
jgi:hypothetical protein